MCKSENEENPPDFPKTFPPKKQMKKQINRLYSSYHYYLINMIF